MTDWIANNAPWFWLIIGIALLVGEMLVPGIYLLWIGMAAIITAGIISVMVEPGFLVQSLIFGGLSVASILLARRYLQINPTETDQENLSRRGDQQIGKVYPLADPIENGTGRVKIGDTLWTVEGPDLPEGTRVRIVAVEGAAIRVEADA